MKLRKNIKAFTLVELIVTMAVLGVLVLLAVPSLLNYTEQAKLTRIQHDTRIMENKIAEVLNQDNNYNEWDDNEKDLGTLILRNQLFEKEGLAARVDKSHLARGVNLAQSDSGLGVGGSLIELGDGETTGYKIIPEEFKTAISTRLEGTFYSNENGKVYYETNKPLASIRQKQELACVSAEDLDYEFSVINGKGTITGYNGTLTHLYIPSVFLIDGKCVPVQVIGSGAFSNFGALVRVYIPQSVVRIEERAFEGNKLTQVEIPHSVNYVGENAFYNNNLSSETIVIKNESSNMTIVHGAFSGQPSGEVKPTYTPVTDKDLGIVFDRSTGKIVASTGHSVSISGSTSGFGNSSNIDNTSVSRNSYESYVKIPSTIVVENVVHEVKEVAQGAYQGQGIIFVEFPDTLERIEDYAFAGNQLINVTIPSNVGYVGNYAFAYNEINGERTMDFVEIKGQGRFEDNIDNLGDITSSGTKRDKVGNANLLDHIFITSSANFEIPEEYNPGPKTANPNVPNPPSINNITLDSAVVDGGEGTEVSIDNKIWHESPHTFKDLSQGTIYNVYSRYKESNSYFASQASEHAIFSTPEIPSEPLEFNYTGGVQTYIVPIDGRYTLEAWGAQGASTSGGRGGYSKAIFEFKARDTIYIYVGQKGVESYQTYSFNGGGYGEYWTHGDKYKGFSGGGSTDFRLIGGSWDNLDGLKSRFIVAGGGGSNPRSIDIRTDTIYHNYAGGFGGGANMPGGRGSGENSTYSASGLGGALNSGSFGKGTPGRNHILAIKGGGGGGGWYGGGSGRQYGSGGGGSGYVDTQKAVVRSIVGTSGINTGHGRAKITYIGE